MTQTKGFTILEIIILVLILSYVFLGLFQGVSFIVKTNYNIEQKNLAIFLGEELKEWLIGEKENDWGIFFSRTNKIYCFNNQELNWPSSACSRDDYSLLGKFKRELELISNDTHKVNYTIYVSWKSETGINVISYKGILSMWEQ